MEWGFEAPSVKESHVDDENCEMRVFGDYFVGKHAVKQDGDCSQWSVLETQKVDFSVRR